MYRALGSRAAPRRRTFQRTAPVKHDATSMRTVVAPSAVSFPQTNSPVMSNIAIAHTEFFPSGIRLLYPKSATALANLTIAPFYIAAFFPVSPCLSGSDLTSPAAANAIVALNAASGAAIEPVGNPFSWLQLIASAYEEYRFTQFSISYIPVCTATTLGQIYIGFCPDLTLGVGAFNSSQSISSLENSVSGNIWTPATLKIKIGSSATLSGFKTVPTSAGFIVGDNQTALLSGRQQFQYGNIIIGIAELGMAGMSAAYAQYETQSFTYGNLKIQYAADFRAPVVQPIIATDVVLGSTRNLFARYSQAGWLSDTGLFGSSATQKPEGNGGVVFMSNQAYSASWYVPSGAWLVSFTVYGDQLPPLQGLPSSLADRIKPVFLSTAVTPSLFTISGTGIIVNNVSAVMVNPTPATSGSVIVITCSVLSYGNTPNMTNRQQLFFNFVDNNVGRVYYSQVDFQLVNNVGAAITNI